MINFIKRLSLVALMLISGTVDVKACHGSPLLNYVVTVNPTNVTINANSDPATCGCGPYYMEVEVSCTGAFTGAAPTCASGAWGTYPWYHSLLNVPGYSAPLWTENCVLEPYNSVVVPFAGLCPGQTYWVRAREMVCGSSSAGPWTASQSFVVPGVAAPLTASINASTTNLCPPNCANLTASATGGCLGGGTYNYDWSHIGGTNNPSAIAVCPAVTTTYSCTVTTPCGQVSTQTVTITVTIPPVAGTASVSPSSVCSGQSATLTLSGYTGTIQWQSGPTSTGPWTNMVGGTTSPFNTGPISSNTCYQAIVSGCGTVTSNVVCVTMTVAPPINVTITDPLCFGGTGTATATPGFSAYSWSSSGNTTNVESGLLAGNYTVTGTTSGGCTSTTNFTVNQPTQIIINSINSTPVLCNGGSTGTGTASASGGTGSLSYVWNPGSISGQSVTGLSAQVYTVTVTDANGCQVTGTTTVTQPTILALNMNSTPSTCGSPNGSATVIATGGAGGYQYLWSNGGTTSTITGLVPGPYTVTVTDANNCQQTSIVNVGLIPSTVTSSATISNVTCFGSCDGSITLSNPTGGTPPYTYLWSNSSTNQNQTNLCPGTYSVTITDQNGCTFVINNINVSQPNQLTSSLNAVPSAICIGQTSNISSTPGGGTPGYSYLWSTGATTQNISVSPVVTTTYNLTTTDLNGCTVNSSVTVIVNPPLNILASGGTTICSGQSANLSSNGGGGNGGPYSYIWTPGGPGQNITVNPSTTTTYTVTLSDGCSPSVTSTVTVVVNPLPNVTYTTTSLTGCEPLTITYTNTTPNSSNCVWIINGNTYNSCSATITFPTQGTYNSTLTITDNNGCSNTSSNIVATVWPLPTAIFTPQPPITNILTPTITFNNLSSAGSYQWDFGDGNTSTSPFPQNTYSDTGTYTIQLIVTTVNGCVDTAYGFVHIDDIFSIYVPNAFTPNGDGKNDTFYPVMTGVESCDFWIFNRWGEMIYHSDSGRPWDSTYKGKDVKEDVYVWKIIVRDKDRKAHEFVGHVSVIR